MITITVQQRKLPSRYDIVQPLWSTRARVIIPFNLPVENVRTVAAWPEVEVTYCSDLSMAYTILQTAHK
jgi:hypothetical protein